MVRSLDEMQRYGLLPIAVVLASVLGARLGAIGLPRSLPRERALFGAVGTVAVLVTIVRVLGRVDALSRAPIIGALAACTIASIVIGRERRVELSWRRIVTTEIVPVVAVSGAAVAATALAAYFLPVWQWDGLGYHLPYVNFALQDHGFAGVPEDMAYLGTYPHAIEDYFLAWRAMLPDDRLVDAAQIPLGLIGALAIAVIARQAGARRDHAAAAGLLWLTLPAVFLQLPTNYIDVGAAAMLLSAAAFTLAEPTNEHLVAAGIALGLFLGSKPNAPMGVTILFAVLAVRGWKAGRRGAIVGSGAVALLLGAESYVLNLAKHGNPIWPVQMKLGPIVLPGDVPMAAVLSSGCASPRVEGPLPIRILRSWTALDAPPIFDMRYGGLGLLFLVALPIAIALVVRRRSIVLAIVMAATLASPDPAIPRYILAFPGIVFALAASQLSTLASPWARRGVLGLGALAAAVAVWRAYPALVGEGPPLADYRHMNEQERTDAVGADGPPGRFHDALAKMNPGETAAFDSSLELSYLAWPADLSTRALHVPDGASEADAKRILADPKVSLLIVGEGSPIAKAALGQGQDGREDEGRFTQLFRCRSRVPPACLAEAATGAKEPSGEKLLDILNQRWPSCVVLHRK